MCPSASWKNVGRFLLYSTVSHGVSPDQDLSGSLPLLFPLSDTRKVHNLRIILMEKLLRRLLSVFIPTITDPDNYSTIQAMARASRSSGARCIIFPAATGGGCCGANYCTEYRPVNCDMLSGVKTLEPQRNLSGMDLLLGYEYMSH